MTSPIATLRGKRASKKNLTGRFKNEEEFLNAEKKRLEAVFDKVDWKDLKKMHP